jgi:hypothetical protein
VSCHIQSSFLIKKKNNVFTLFALWCQRDHADGIPIKLTQVPHANTWICIHFHVLSLYIVASDASTLCLVLFFFWAQHFRESNIWGDLLSNCIEHVLRVKLIFVF